LLELVKRGHVQVLGRKPWLLDPKVREQSKFKYAAWYDDYDDEIARIALGEERDRVPDIDRKVRFAPEEEGWTWADRTLASSSQDDKHCVDHFKNLLSTCCLPKGTLEKADVETSEKAKLRIALRDAKNHADAFSLSGADRPVTFSETAESLGQVLPEVKMAPDRDAVPTSEKLKALIEVLVPLTKPRDLGGLLTLLSWKDRPQIVREIGRICDNDASISRVLTTDIRNGTRAHDWLNSLVPDTTYQRVITAGEVVAGIAMWAFTGKPALSLVPAILARAEGLLQKLSVLSAPNYSGPVLPFVLAYDTKHPTYRQIEAICRELLRG